MKIGDWWFFVIGVIFSILGLAGPKVGLQLYASGRPGGRGEMLPPNWRTRVLFFMIGLVLIGLGMYGNSN